VNSEKRVPKYTPPSTPERRSEHAPQNTSDTVKITPTGEPTAVRTVMERELREAMGGSDDNAATWGQMLGVVRALEVA